MKAIRRAFYLLAGTGLILLIGSCSSPAVAATQPALTPAATIAPAPTKTPAPTLAPTPAATPAPAASLTDTDKSNIETIIQVARQAGPFEKAGELPGKTLYSLLDYLYNDGPYMDNGQNSDTFVGDPTEGFTEAGARRELEMVLGKTVDFQGCIDYAKNLDLSISGYPGKVYKAYEDGKFVILAHDPDGGASGEPVDVERIATATDLGAGNYALTTNVHKITKYYDEKEGTDTDVIVGHSSYTVERDSGSIYGFIVLSSQPAG